jgi:uncharacterized membrane protein
MALNGGDSGGELQARLDAISAALARIVARQNEMDIRLARIEQEMKLAAASSGAKVFTPIDSAFANETTPASEATEPAMHAPPLPDANAGEQAHAAPPPLPESASWPQPQPSASAPALETRFGLNWLNRVAVITLLFGAAFLFKYAAENDWLGAGSRVALGIAAATLSLAAGEWMSLRGQRIFGQGLTGLALALFYLSFYAAFGFYHLLSQGIVFALMSLTTISAAALALHYRSQAVAMLGLIGGFLTPPLLGTGEDRMWTLAAYSLILSAGALFLAHRRRWTALRYISLAGSWLLYGGWSSEWLGEANRPQAFAWVCLIFGLFFAAAALDLRPWLLALNAGIAFAVSYDLLNRGYRSELGLVAFALAAIHAAVARAYWEHDRRFAHLAAAIALAGFTLALPIQFAGFQITIAWALEAAALAWISARYGRPRVEAAALAVFLLVLVRLLAFDAAPFGGGAYTAIANRRFLAFAVAAASLWTGSRFVRTPPAPAVLYALGHLVLLWSLGLEVTGWAERNAGPADMASVSSTGISIAITLYALGLIAAGVALRKPFNRALGLALIVLVVVKLYLIDVWALGRVFRVAAFLALGALLLLVSYLYSRFRPALEKILGSGNPWRDQPQ